MFFFFLMQMTKYGFISSFWSHAIMFVPLAVSCFYMLNHVIKRANIIINDQK